LDLNGDSAEDFAVLLKLERDGSATRHDSQWPILLVFFLNDGNGGYAARSVRSVSASYPFGVTLTLQPAGVVRNRSTGANVTLANPGVMLSFCEKSAATYYLDGNRIRGVPIAD
jgi:hypothetical protein